jgi:hypothetical protein
VRRAAARLQCANNLKQIALGLHTYADTDSAGGNTNEPSLRFPAGTLPDPSLPVGRRLSWLVEILPYVEQDNLFRHIDRGAAWDDRINEPAVERSLKVFQCPDWLRESSPQAGNFTPYLGVAGVGADAVTLPPGDRRAGVFGYDRRTSIADLTDGTSNTLLILESARANGPWAQGGAATARGLDPDDTPYLGSGRPFGGTHFAENTVLSRGRSVGCNAALADGSVRFLAETVNARVLEGLATVAAGEEVGTDW